MKHIDTFTAKVTDNKVTANCIETARRRSIIEGRTVCIMSNGTDINVIHLEYTEDFEKDGYWIAYTFEDGHAVYA